MQNKQRHYCTCCGRKLYRQKMEQVYYPMLKQTAYHCPACLSAHADMPLIKQTGDFEPLFIELFSGSKTISRQAESLGFRTFTVDIEPEYQPDLCADILQVKGTQFPRGRPFFLWASVPCTWFTILSIANHWRKQVYTYRKYQYMPLTAAAETAVTILEKTLHLISVINPVYFMLENPRGAMRHLPQVKGIPYRYTVSYADYGFQVYKPTDLFTNIPGLQLHQLKGTAGRRFTEHVRMQKDAFTRSIVPPELVNSILTQVMERHGLPALQAVNR